MRSTLLISCVSLLGAMVIACSGGDGESATTASSGTQGSSSGETASASDSSATGPSASGSGGGTSTGDPQTSSSGGPSTGDSATSSATSGSTGSTGPTSDATSDSTSGPDTTVGTSATETAGTTGMCDATGGDICPEGTCKLFDDGPCEEPSGPVGNGCCACECGFCSAFCRCAAPDTPIATPSGERPIEELRPGELVYSVDRGQLVAVPVLEVSKVPAPLDHAVLRVALADGRVIELSPGHPTADGRLLRELRAGDLLGDVAITGVESIPYAHAFTHDILPASSSGAYFAAGALMGSTLAPAPSECGP
ncbi:MAG: hypothetical protein H6713_12570 [Myxococcales bacterium]|nr:hypothetical protein [Myxococcales bacterium]